MFHWHQPFAAHAIREGDFHRTPLGSVTADRNEVVIRIDRRALQNVSYSDAVLVARLLTPIDGASDWGGVDYPKLELTPQTAHLMAKLIERLAGRPEQTKALPSSRSPSVVPESAAFAFAD